MNEFYITRQTLGTSKSLKSMGEPMMTIWLKGVHDGETYRTYVVMSHDNWNNWVEIVARDGQDIVIGFENIKYVGANREIINADCRPVIVSAGPKQRRYTPKQQSILDSIDSLRARIEDLFD